MPSLIDYFLINELGNNVDAYRLSTFFYKDKNSVDSLFHFGPLWDFNLAFGNADYCGGQSVEGWAYLNSGYCSNTPLWWERLQEDTTFQNEVRCRYDALRKTTLSVSSIFNYLDSMSMDMGAGIDRNYDKWPILGMYVWPNAFIGQTYDQEMNYLKQWLMGRLQWLDTNLPGACSPISDVRDVTDLDFTILPNPANQTVSIMCPPAGNGPVLLTLTSGNGIRWFEKKVLDAKEDLDLSACPEGLYYITLTTPQGVVRTGTFVVQH